VKELLMAYIQRKRFFLTKSPKSDICFSSSILPANAIVDIASADETQI